MHGDDIALCIYLLQIAEAGIFLEFLVHLSRSVIIYYHRHVEALRASYDVLRDSAVAENAEGLFIRVHADSGLPFPVMYIIVAQHYVAAACQYQAEGQIRNGVRVCARGVADGDAHLAALLYRDIIQTYAVLADDLQLSALFKYLLGERVGAYNKRVEFRYDAFKLLLRKIRAHHYDFKSGLLQNIAGLAVYLSEGSGRDQNFHCHTTSHLL